MNSGTPPTAFHALTGELTAPGIFFVARFNNDSEFLVEIMIVAGSGR
jgi:hypothetical protein